MSVHVLDVAQPRASADPALLPGELLADKYRIERVLGQGGMGVVLGARNVLLGKRVAVKVVARGAGGLAGPRLLMEARAAARIESDHAVRIFDVGHTAQGDPYLVMEYLEGQSLAQLLRDAVPVSAAQAVLWVLQACEALAEAHAHGIVHRDVKPANLFLEQRPDGSRRIKVLDFGIAKLPAGERLTTTTHPIGSPIYMAPEQLANAVDVDLRVDVWGVGCVLYELLTGRAPFEAGSVLELAAKVASGSRRSLRSLRPELSEALSQVVDRCLEVDRAHRFGDLSELKRTLLPLSHLGEATLDLPIARLGYALTRPAGEDGARSDALRESTPALTNSLSAPKSGPRRAVGRASLAALAAVFIVAVVLSIQRHARAPVELPATAAPVDALEPSLSAGPEPRSETKNGVPRTGTPERLVERTPPPAHSSTKPSARRAPPRSASPKTKSRTGESATSSPGRSSAVVRGAPLPIDREAPW